MMGYFAHQNKKEQREWLPDVVSKIQKDFSTRKRLQMWQKLFGKEAENEGSQRLPACGCL